MGARERRVNHAVARAEAKRLGTRSFNRRFRRLYVVYGMRMSWKNVPVEIVFTSAMVLIMSILSVVFNLPVRLPTSGGATFLGFHYLLPLLGVGAWAVCALFGQRSDLLRVFLIAVPCYFVVLLVHFNIKLWVPHINPTTYDAAYWKIDQALRPLVDGCIVARRHLAVFVPFGANLYMYGFIALFYLSFCFHAVRTPAVFRHLVLSALVFQGLGTIGYLVAPALGPFVFEQGASPFATQAQDLMLRVHDRSIAGGPQWLAQNGADALMMGLGAMPSLHAGGSFLFLWFAYRHARVLLPTYVPIFVFILVAAISSRWHYLVDLPIGIALAVVSIRLAETWCRDPQAADEGSVVAPAPIGDLPGLPIAG